MDRETAQRLAILIILPIAFFWGLYHFFFKERVDELFDLKKTLTVVEKEINTTKPKDLSSGPAVPEITAVESRLKEIGSKIPSEIDLPYLMEEFITDSSAGLDIDYALVQPQPLVAEQKFKRLPVDIEFTADFNNLNLYLAQLDTLPMKVRIDQLSIEKDKDLKKLDVKAAISAFLSGGPTGQSAEARANFAQVPSDDPFYPGSFPSKGTAKAKAAQKKTGTGLPKLKGFFMDGKPKAFINNSFASVGDTVDGYKIKKIKNDSVIVTKSKRSYTLRLGR